MPGKNIMQAGRQGFTGFRDFRRLQSIVNDDGVLTAYTTDGVGFMRAVAENGHFGA